MLAENLLEVQVLTLHLNQKSKDRGQLVLMNLLRDSGTFGKFEKP